MLKVARKGSDKWAVEGTVSGQRVRRIVRGTKADAEEVAISRAREATRSRALGVTFGRTARAYADQGGRHKTTAGTAKLLGTWFDGVDVGKFDIEDVRDRVAGRGVAPQTVRRYMRAAITILKWGDKVGLYALERVPRAILPPEADPRDRFLESVAEIDHLVSHADPWFRPFVVMLFQTGGRMGAMVKLKWRDVTETQVTFSTKKGSGRLRRYSVPLNERAKAALAELRARQGGNPRPEGAVFRGASGGTLWTQRVYWPWQRMCKAAGVENFRPHDARRTFATLLIRRGVAAKVIKDLLGHEDLSMLDRYAYLAPSQLSDAVMVLDR